MDSVLSQAMYFGLAFSRVGLDFRALMVPIFEKAILEQSRLSLSQANVKFEESLHALNWSELVENNTLTASNSNATSASRSLDAVRTKTNLIVSPPLDIMDYQPLAVYLNAILNLFNELRLCAPLSLHEKILGILLVLC